MIETSERNITDSRFERFEIRDLRDQETETETVTETETETEKECGSF